MSRPQPLEQRTQHDWTQRSGSVARAARPPGRATAPRRRTASAAPRRPGCCRAIAGSRLLPPPGNVRPRSLEPRPRESDATGRQQVGCRGRGEPRRFRESDATAGTAFPPFPSGRPRPRRTRRHGRADRDVGLEYKHWRGVFYPPAGPVARWFDYYARHFDTVEINNTFYRLPAAETFAAWRGRRRRGFLYAVKASRFLTHMKKLKDPEEPLGRLFLGRATSEGDAGPGAVPAAAAWGCDLRAAARTSSPCCREASRTSWSFATRRGTPTAVRGAAR